MAGFIPDSNCMIAVVSDWHPHHQAAIEEISRRLDSGEPMFLAAPSVVETFSILTRLPLAYRVSPQDCLAMIQSGFLDYAASVVALDAAAYLGVVRRAADSGITGGPVYDAVIAACARAAGADTLLTFNERHFARFAGNGLAIVVPGTDGR